MKTVSHPSHAATALAILVASVAGRAQLPDMTVTAATEMRVAVNSEADTLPAGRDLTQGMNLMIQRDVGLGTMSAASAVTPQSSATEVGLVFTGSSSAWVFQQGAGTCGAGAHTITVHFVASQPIAGHLAITISGAATRFATQPSASVEVVGGPDVVGAGIGLYGYGGELDLPVVVDAGGVTVRATLSAQTSNPTPANQVFNDVGIEIRFVGQPGRVRPYGQACSTVLDGFYRSSGATRRLGLTVSDSPAGSFAFLVFGLNPLNFPLVNSDGSSCPLLTDVIVSKAVTVDGSGRAALLLPAPPAMDARVQFLTAVSNSFGFYDWFTSNGLHLRL